MRNTASPLLLALVVTLAPSCRSREGDDGRGSSSGDTNPNGFDKAKLLAAFARCAFDHHKAFVGSADQLALATEAAEANPATRAAAQSQWKGTLAEWQRAELFQFGPSAPSTRPGGQDMRDPIYAWPLASRCQAEQNLVSKAYESPDFATASLVNARSLATLEYLLFYEGADNACPPDNAINAGGQWAAIDGAELALRKRAYAKVVGAAVATRAKNLANAWDPASGNFLATFSEAGKNTTFQSQQMAFNVVSDAMFYLDLQAKNLKVGSPAGLVPGCAAPPCLDQVESPWAKVSKENLRANTNAYAELLDGCAAGGSLGFDDLLVAIGAGSVAQKLDASVKQILGALDALTEPTFEEDLQKNPAGVQALFDALRNNGAIMKADFATVLDLELPQAALTDND